MIRNVVYGSLVCSVHKSPNKQVSFGDVRLLKYKSEGSGLEEIKTEKLKDVLTEALAKDYGTFNTRRQCGGSTNKQAAGNMAGRLYDKLTGIIEFFKDRKDTLTLKINKPDKFSNLHSISATVVKNGFSEPVFKDSATIMTSENELLTPIEDKFIKTACNTTLVQSSPIAAV